VVDLEYSLDKKVEQDLWNHVFKNQINAMQTQAKDRQVGLDFVGLKLFFISAKCRV
jgi:hypothetical protein